MNNIIGNYETQNYLVDYLNQDFVGSITLNGPKGIGKYKLALTAATKLLNSNNLSTHPDLIIIKPLENSIKLEQIHDMQDSIIYYPTTVSRRVIIIDDADKMNIAAQNCLLKTLEDKQKYNLFIFIAHQSLLPTIHSRTSNFKLKKLQESDMSLYFIQNEVNEKDMLFFLSVCNGSIGTYNELVNNEQLLVTLKSFYNYFETNSVRDENILKILNLYKEKDKLNFFLSYKEYTYILFNLLHELFSNFYLYQLNLIDNKKFNYSIMSNNYTIEDTLIILEKIKEHEQKSKILSYSKDDFFDFICSLI